MALTEKLAILVKDTTLGDTLSFARGNTEMLYPYSAGNIVYDTKTTASANPVTSLTWEHICTGSNLILFVSVENYTSGVNNVTGITYNGVALTKIREVQPSYSLTSSMWYLINPASGTHNIIASADGSCPLSCVGVSFSGVAQTQPNIVTGSVINTGTGITSLTTSVITTVNKSWALLWTTNSAGESTAGANTTLLQGGFGWDGNCGLFYNTNPISPEGSFSMTYSFPSGAAAAIMVYFEPISNTPPDTATLLETDSGDSSTVWDMSTIANRENLGSETGTLKYQYSCHNTTGNPTWNGTWLTLAQLQAISNPTGRYLQLKVQFADGIASFQDSYIEALIQGGAVDFPAESDVRDGVTFDNGNKAGTFDLPAVANVRKDITFDGATKTGLLDLPAVANVRKDTVYDNTTKTGLLDLPSVNDVEKGVKFDSLSKTGTFKAPAVADVLAGVKYGANDTEYTGTLPAVAVADYPAEADVLEDVVFDSGAKIGTLKKYSVTTNPADTLRQRIIDTIDARLKTITIANGYKTALGSNIFEWRVTTIDPDTEMPGAIHKDTQDTIDLTIGLHLHTLEIEISISAKGSTTPADMRKLIGDVHEMIGTDVTWGSLAEDTKIKSEKIIAAHEENKFIGIEITIEVEFTTNVFNPFS